MKWSNMHLGTHVFFFSFWGGCWTFVVPNVLPWNSHYVLIKFLMSSQHVSQVSNVFLNMFLIILHFISYPFLQGLSSTLVTYINNPREEITTYLFWDCPKLDLFCYDESIKNAHDKRKKNQTLGIPITN